MTARPSDPVHTPPPAGDPVGGERTAVVNLELVPGYDLLELIGAGGFGRVYRSRQHTLDRHVAVKVITADADADPLAAKRFEAEAVAVARLHHPNVVQAYDFGRAAGRLFLAMELLDGEDLGRRVRERGPLDERTTWQVVRQAAAGLAHAAARDVVHRDVKPANLFLTPAPTGSGLPPGVPAVKVTDFGLALAKWGDQAPDRLTTTGAAVGTPSYMAPEQWRGGAVDLRADIYALGATAYFALTGRPPFDGRTVWDVVAKKIEHTPPPLAVGLEASARLIADMMHPNRARRVQTYEQLIDRIDRLPYTPIAPRRPAVRRWAVAAVTAALVGAAAVPVVRWKTAAPSPGPPAPLRYVSDGRQDALFDGASLEQWAAVGAWAVDADDEGTPVLCGSGQVRRPFAAPPDYRITVGLDVFEADAAEVQFAVPADPAGGNRLAVRVSKDGGAVFGTRDGDGGRFRPTGTPVPYPSASWQRDRRPYLEVRVERSGGVWSAWFHGELVGRAADDGTPKADALRVAAVNGRVRIDTAVLERLRAAE